MPTLRMSRRACAYHLGNMNGPTYDSDGKECGGLSADDKVYIAVAAGLCGTVLLILGSIFAWKQYKARTRTHSDRPMSSLGTPLMTSSFASPCMASRPTLSRLVSAPSLENHSSQGHYSSEDSHSTPGSPFSPNPDDFHFPILSADGHLLPPPPASSRQSWIDASQALIRPLPSPPLDSSDIIQPVPKTPKRWSYQQEHSPSPEKVVGLYDGFDRDYETASMQSSPRITRVERPLSIYEPQRAVLYRSMSAEGEEMVIEYHSDEGHRRY